MNFDVFIQVMPGPPGPPDPSARPPDGEGDGDGGPAACLPAHPPGSPELVQQRALAHELRCQDIKNKRIRQEARTLGE